MHHTAPLIRVLTADMYCQISVATIQYVLNCPENKKISWTVAIASFSVSEFKKNTKITVSSQIDSEIMYGKGHSYM